MMGGGGKTKNIFFLRRGKGEKGRKKLLITEKKQEQPNVEKRSIQQEKGGKKGEGDSDLLYLEKKK